MIFIDFHNTSTARRSTGSLVYAVQGWKLPSSGLEHRSTMVAPAAQLLGVLLLLAGWGLSFPGAGAGASSPAPASHGSLGASGLGADPCCQAIAHADCWGFHPGGDSTASIQVRNPPHDCLLKHAVLVPFRVNSGPCLKNVLFRMISGPCLFKNDGFPAEQCWLQAAIDCPLAHTVIVSNMSSRPWIVAPPPDTLPCRHGSSCYRAALNFSSSNQRIIFEPGAVVEAKRWSFHGIKDCLVSDFVFKMIQFVLTTMNFVFKNDD